MKCRNGKWFFPLDFDMLSETIKHAKSGDIIHIDWGEYKQSGGGLDILMNLTEQEIDTICVMMDVCQRKYDCDKCGNQEYCTSAWKKFARVKKQSPQSHAPDEIGGTDEPSEGQALGSEKAEEGES